MLTDEGEIVEGVPVLDTDSHGPDRAVAALLRPTQTTKQATPTIAMAMPTM